ncbi:MAG: hypothetical protein ACRENI_00225 [Gemmatimonadaceae bacterium]
MIGRGVCAAGCGSGAAVLLAAALLATMPGAASAQVHPGADWRTLSTEHFRVHFTPALESLARRAAASAEIAYDRLAAELETPRQPIDLVVADNVDFTNGQATTFPSNRIVVYATPPVGGRSLRFFDDWSELVITHELVHIFHLDRARGIWAFAQHIFGRNPFLFPNQYGPGWLAEGLAVYYESRITGSGRIYGSEHHMIARAAAAADAFPRLDQLSLATPRFPGGQSAYAYGSLLFDYLARTRGAEAVGEFVEQTSGQLIPFRLDHAARETFGVSFSAALSEWRDSLAAFVSDPGTPLPGFRELTGDGWFALNPRWRGDSAIIYSALVPEDVPGAYRVSLGGDVERVGRRNGLEPNVPLADGGLLFAQLEFITPYVIRSDLYIERDGETRRLTRGARLTLPDARADGSIIAVQGSPGTTALVRVSGDGRVSPITIARADTHWTEPRWSPAGDRIAAVRWSRGGFTEVVVLDTLGAVRQVVARDRAVNSTPSWTADGSAILYASDRLGETNIYLAPLDAPGAPPLRLSDAVTGVFYPEVSAHGEYLASVLFRADGYHLGVAPFSPEAGEPDSSSAPARRGPPPEPIARYDGASSDYSPWRSLIPRYWMPSRIERTSLDELIFGALTSGADIIGRHSYAVQGALATNLERYELDASYRYRGFGQPVLDFSASYDNDTPSLFTPADTIYETETSVAAAATLERPRFRSYSWLQLGGEFERLQLRSVPDTLLAALGAFERIDRPALFVSGGWSNARRPALSISPEDGVALAARVRNRWLVADGERIRGASQSVVGTAIGYKSLDLPGFAHHVIALRLAGGWADADATSGFEIGGTSGNSAAILPGYAIGDSRRSFPVRGFDARTTEGIRALGGSLEYRAPLILPARGLRLLPFFLDRTSLTLFGDAAASWCPAALPASAACFRSGTERAWLASAGAELNVDAALLQYDFPYRFRLGAAVPVSSEDLASAELSVYLTLGLSF